MASSKRIFELLGNARSIDWAFRLAAGFLSAWWAGLNMPATINPYVAWPLLGLSFTGGFLVLSAISFVVLGTPLGN
jgi:hypothetical protein